VIEEADARGDLPIAAIEVEAQLDLGLLGLAIDLCCARDV
jgi:hypothetical protein